MGWGWGWQDVEFYDRLNFYKIPYDSWYLNNDAVKSKIIDLSTNEESESLSVHNWTQGRPNVTFNDVPKIIPPKDAGIDFDPYEENYWYSEIIKEGHINLCHIINALPHRERDQYYSNSGYKRVNMNKVSHTCEDDVNWFTYDTRNVFSDSNEFPLVELPISRKTFNNSPKINEIEYQIIDNKLIKLKII